MAKYKVIKKDGLELPYKFIRYGKTFDTSAVVIGEAQIKALLGAKVIAPVSEKDTEPKTEQITTATTEQTAIASEKDTEPKTEQITTATTEQTAIASEKE